MYDRPEVNMRWVIANQPIINAFDRVQPYWWVFDPQLDPSEWVRQPPPHAEYIKDLDITRMTSPERFPVSEGQEIRNVIGIRTSESMGRLMGLHSAGGFVLGAVNQYGVRDLWPIYDWSDGDVWLAHKKFGWDYNSAYNVMLRHGYKKQKMRIGPPTMNPAGGEGLRRICQVAWPEWWNRVCRRLPSVRTYAKYGTAAVSPHRRLGETWEQCFERTCIENAPAWIRDRATITRDRMLSTHAKHSHLPFPDQISCAHGCSPTLGSWKHICHEIYLGDPFSMKVTFLPYVDPEFFRPGSGTWKGKPNF
jgi:predicted phosphoadenosine phosphosulfate sulfurtransferase